MFDLVLSFALFGPLVVASIGCVYAVAQLVAHEDTE